MSSIAIVAGILSVIFILEVYAEIEKRISKRIDNYYTKKKNETKIKEPLFDTVNIEVDKEGLVWAGFSIGNVTIKYNKYHNTWCGYYCDLKFGIELHSSNNGYIIVDGLGKDVTKYRKEINAINAFLHDLIEYDAIDKYGVVVWDFKTDIIWRK